MMTNGMRFSNNGQNAKKTDLDTHRENYVTANRFYVEIEGNITASFTECSGLGVQIDKETYFEGGVNDQQRIFLKQAKFNDVTLKRGMTDDLTFWNWLTTVLTQRNPENSISNSNRRNINILVFNQAWETMQCWTLIGAVPVGWKAPSFQANATTVAIEELTLAYEGLTIIKKEGAGGAKDANRDGKGYFQSK